MSIDIEEMREIPRPKRAWDEDKLFAFGANIFWNGTFVDD